MFAYYLQLYLIVAMRFFANSNVTKREYSWNILLSSKTPYFIGGILLKSYQKEKPSFVRVKHFWLKCLVADLVVF